MAKTEYMLQTESVIKQYRQSDSVITAVNRVNIKIEKGEFVAIIGSSGSGKSTFLHICAGLDRANAGRILIDNEDITSLDFVELNACNGGCVGGVLTVENGTILSKANDLETSNIGINLKTEIEKVREQIQNIE